MKIFSIFMLLAVFYLTACNRPTSPESANKADSAAAFDISSVRNTINHNDKIFEEAIVKGDSAKVVALYATTAHMYPDNGPPIENYEGIKRFFGEFVKMGIKEFKLETVDVYGNNDNVIEEGKYKIGNGKGKTIDEGKYIEIYRKENGEWKIYRDIFNSNLPIPKSSK